MKISHQARLDNLRRVRKLKKKRALLLLAFPGSGASSRTRRGIIPTGLEFRLEYATDAEDQGSMDGKTGDALMRL